MQNEAALLRNSPGQNVATGEDVHHLQGAFKSVKLDWTATDCLVALGRRYEAGALANSAKAG